MARHAAPAVPIGAAPAPPEAPTGDVNADGAVTPVDLLAILGAWGDCARCPEDVDGNGVVDLLDLLEVIAAWR